MEPKSIKNRRKNRWKFVHLLGSDLSRILLDFGCKMEAHMQPKSNKIKSKFERLEPAKNIVFPWKNKVCYKFGAWTMKQNINKKPFKKQGHPGKASWHRFFIDLNCLRQYTRSGPRKIVSFAKVRLHNVICSGVASSSASKLRF